MGVGLNAFPWLLYPRGRDSEPIGHEAGWASGRSKRVGKKYKFCTEKWLRPEG